MTKSVSSLMALSDTITKLEEMNREYAKAIEANKVLIDKSKVSFQKSYFGYFSTLIDYL